MFFVVNNYGCTVGGLIPKIFSYGSLWLKNGPIHLQTGWLATTLITMELFMSGITLLFDYGQTIT